MSDDTDQAVSVKSDDGQTATFQIGSVLAILTSADRSTSTIMLSGGVQIGMKGNGEKLRKRIFGVSTTGGSAGGKKRTGVGRAKAPGAAPARSGDGAAGSAEA